MSRIEYKTQLPESEFKTIDFKPAPIFQPSKTAKVLSFFAAPRQLTGMTSIALTALAGFSLPVTLGIGGAVVATQMLLTKILAGGNTLRAAIFLQAEHLSRIDIQGGLPFIILPSIIKALEFMRSNNALVAKNALENLLTYENYFSYLGIGNYFLVKDLLLQINELEAQQILAFPLSYMDIIAGGHIIVGSLQRTANGKYILRVHNGGEGLDFHYYRFEKATGRKIYQTTLEIVDIEFAELVKFIHSAASIHAFKLGNNVEKIYKLIPRLGGKVLPPSEDPRYWMRSQIGPSCSGYSDKCFLKFILSPIEWKQFSQKFLDLAVDDLSKELRTSWLAQSREHYLAYEELSAKRDRLYQSTSLKFTECKETLLTKATVKVRKRFWSHFFPLNFVYVSMTHLGLDYESFATVSELNDFKLLEQSFAQIDGNKISNTVVENGIRFSTNIGCKPDMGKVVHFKETFTAFFNRLSMDLYTAHEQKELLKIKKNLMQKTEGFYGGQLYCFYELALKKFKLELNEPLAKELMKIIEYLNRGHFSAARAALNNIYLTFDQMPNQLSASQKQQYLYVMCQTLYLSDSVKLEDMELRSGLAMIFLKLGLDLPQYLQKHLAIYCDWRLDKSFKESPWKQFILDHFQAQSIVKSSWEPQMLNKLLVR